LHTADPVWGQLQEPAHHARESIRPMEMHDVRTALHLDQASPGHQAGCLAGPFMRHNPIARAADDQRRHRDQRQLFLYSVAQYVPERQ
jgi:hypothetical protein